MRREGRPRLPTQFWERAMLDDGVIKPFVGEAEGKKKQKWALHDSFSPNNLFQRLKTVSEVESQVKLFGNYYYWGNQSFWTQEFCFFILYLTNFLHSL